MNNRLFNQGNNTLSSFTLGNDNYLEIDVPGDGSCLFYCLALSVLLPAVNNIPDFAIQFGQLFENTSLRLPLDPEELRQRLINYNGRYHLTDVDVEKLMNNHFRNKLVRHMLDNKAYFEHVLYTEERSFEAAMEAIKNPKTWGGHREIEAASQVLKRQIRVYEKDETGLSRLRERAIYNNDNENKNGSLHLLYMNRNHYHYLIKPEHLSSNAYQNLVHSNPIPLSLTANQNNVLDVKGEDKEKSYPSQEIQDLTEIAIIQQAIPNSLDVKKKTINGNSLISYIEDDYGYAYDHTGTVHIFSLNTRRQQQVISIQREGNDLWASSISEFIYYKDERIIFPNGEGMSLKVYDKISLTDKILGKSIIKASATGYPYAMWGNLTGGWGFWESAFLNKKYMIVSLCNDNKTPRGEKTVVLDIDNNFSEVKNSRLDYETFHFAVLPKHNMLALVASGDYSYIRLYKYDENGNLKFSKSWRHGYFNDPCRLTALGGGQLASSGINGDIIHVWDIDRYLSNEQGWGWWNVGRYWSNSPFKYDLTPITKSQGHIESLLSLPNNLLCAHYSDKTVVIWSLETKKEIAHYTASNITAFGQYLVLFESDEEGKEIGFEIEYLGKYLEKKAIEFFIQKLKTTLEDIYAAAKVANSEWFKRNVSLTSEEIVEHKLEHYLETVENRIEMISGLLLIANVCNPPALIAQSIPHAIHEIVHAAEHYVIGVLPVLKALPKIIHWFKGQHKLNPELLMANFRAAFDDKSLGIFIDHITQYLAWRYQDIVSCFDSETAQRLGDAVAERIAEPFALRMCSWEKNLSLNEKAEIVSNWIYYAADLPF